MINEFIPVPQSQQYDSHMSMLNEYWAGIME